MRSAPPSRATTGRTPPPRAAVPAAHLRPAIACGPSRPRVGAEVDLVAAAQHAIDETERLRFVRSHEVVAIERRLDPLVGLAGVLDVDLVEPALHLDDVLGVPLDVARLA